MDTVQKRSKPKLVNSQSTVSVIFDEYCSKTSIHGIGYLAAKDKSLPEKIWWITVFSISIAACGYLITDTWIKWRENPVILSFSQEQTPIWKVPFPAITICPLYKVNRTEYNFTKNYFNRNKLYQTDKKKLWDISLICDFELERTFGPDNFTNEDVIKHIKEVSLNMNKVIQLVKWQNKPYELVESLFVTQITSHGVCFTFNSLSQKDIYTNQLKENVAFTSENNAHETNWSIEDGYPNTNNTKNYPKRTTQDGSTSGLNILILSTDSGRDFSCGEAISGYKVILHNPAETPRVNHKYFIVPLNNHVTIAVTPKVITTSKKLYNIPVHTRNCYFKIEKKLRFFKIYTKNNCKTECVANITNSLCGCVPFYLPRDNKTKICGLGKMACLENVYEKIISYEMILHNNIMEDSAEIFTDEFEIFKNCNCMPACASIDYSADISSASHSWKKTLTVTELLNSKDKEKTSLWIFRFWKAKFSIDELRNIHQTSQINIFFKESEFIALHRKELYGRTEFLANCGGLLGVFLGFSFLSLLEIIYYVTIRSWIYLRKKKQPAIDIEA